MEINSSFKTRLNEFIDSKRKDSVEGLWVNIRRKRERIKAGSGEKMRKPGEKGAPTIADLIASKSKKKSKDIDYSQR